MEFDDVVNARKSIRKFKSKKPDWRDIIKAIDSAIKAPLAGNIPSIKFVLVDDAKIIRTLAKASQHDFVAQTSYVVVVCNDDTNIVRSYDERGKIYARQQAGASIEQFLLKLTDLGLGGCWIGAFAENQVKTALKIPAQINVEAIIPVGYSFDKTRKKSKPDLDRVLRFNEYKNSFMKPRREVEGL